MLACSGVSPGFMFNQYRPARPILTDKEDDSGVIVQFRSEPLRQDVDRPRFPRKILHNRFYVTYRAHNLWWYRYFSWSEHHLRHGIFRQFGPGVHCDHVAIVVQQQQCGDAPNAVQLRQFRPDCGLLIGHRQPGHCVQSGGVGFGAPAK